MSSAFHNDDRIGDSRDVRTRLYQRPAVLNFDHSHSIPAKTLDISSLGLSVMIDRPLPEGRRVTIDISIVLEDQPTLARFTCRVRSNVLAGMKGFRIGLEFDELDQASSRLLKQIIGAASS
jgi:c-di-GMP-binding flagellar brake protein YcgR